MRFDFLMLADDAAMGEDGKLDIKGGGVTHIRAAELPFTLPAISIVLRFLREPADPDHGQILHLRVVRPDGLAVADVQGDISPASPNIRARRLHAGEDPALVVVSRLENARFETPGRYEFVADLNGDPLGSWGVVLIHEPQPTSSDSVG